MATASPCKMLEEDLICQVCHDVLLKEPYTLRCLHNYCGQCIKNMDRLQKQGISGVLCPVCRRFSAEEDIQINYLIKNIIEGVSHMSEEYSSKLRSDEACCGLCKKGSPVAYCVNCGYELCDVCQFTHLQIKELKAHQIVSIGEGGSTPGTRSATKLCPDHPGFPIKASCMTCRRAVCSECVLGKHNSHTTETIEDALQVLIPEVKAKLQRIQSKCEFAKRVRTSVNNHNDKTATSLKQILVRAQQDMEEKIAKLRSDYKRIEEVVYTQASLKTGMMIEQDLANLVSSMESVTVWGNNLIRAQKSPGLLYEVENELLCSLENLFSQESDIKDAIQYIHKNSATKVFKPTQLPEENLVGQIVQQAELTDDSDYTKIGESKFFVPLKEIHPLEVKKIPAEKSVAGITDSISNCQQNSFNVDKNEPAGSKLSEEMIEMLENVAKSNILEPPANNYPIDSQSPGIDALSLTSESINSENLEQPEAKCGEAEVCIKQDDSSQIWKETKSVTDKMQSFREQKLQYPTVKESYRLSNSIDFTTLSTKSFNNIQTIDTKRKVSRFCYFEDNLWFAFNDYEYIDVYSMDGAFIKSMNKYKLYPKAFHPLSDEVMLVAGQEWLLTIDVTSCRIVTKISPGSFIDVHVSGDLIAALRQKKQSQTKSESSVGDSGALYDSQEHNSVHIHSTKPHYAELKTFGLGHNKGLTLLIHNKFTYVSSGHPYHNIIKYNMKGNILAKYGRDGEKHLYFPYICMADRDGNLLVGSCIKNRLDVLSEGHLYQLEGVESVWPKDAVIVGKYLYVRSDKTVKIYEIVDI